jgi:hypothetical protein
MVLANSFISKKAKKMETVVLILLGLVIIYLISKRHYVTREHLSPGPPSLLTLQKDTVDLDTRLTSLKADFDKMAVQAKQGADAAASAKAQIGLTKYSPTPSGPP